MKFLRGDPYAPITADETARLAVRVQRVRRQRAVRRRRYGTNDDAGSSPRHQSSVRQGRATSSSRGSSRRSQLRHQRRRNPLPPLLLRPRAPHRHQPPAPKSSGPSVEEIVKPVNGLQSAIEAAEKNLERSPSQRDLAALRTSIEKIENNAKDAAENLRRPLEELRSQIGKLGAPPAANEPPEEPDVAAERQRLNGIAAQIDGAIKKAALIEVRARQLIARVQQARQGIFTRFLFRKTDTPLQWRVWQQAGDQLPLARRQIGFVLTNWWSVAKLNGAWPARRHRRVAAQFLRPAATDAAAHSRAPR